MKLDNILTKFQTTALSHQVPFPLLEMTSMLLFTFSLLSSQNTHKEVYMAGTTTQHVYILFCHIKRAIICSLEKSISFIEELLPLIVNVELT